jgi:putative cofactor-binding repeat protein
MGRLKVLSVIAEVCQRHVAPRLMPEAGRRTRMPAAAVALAAGLSLALMAGPVSAETLRVDTEPDTNDGVCAPGACSLRDALAVSAATGTDDVVVLPAGSYPLVLGPLAVAKPAGSITVQGAGRDLTRVSGGGHDRVLQTSGANTTVTISGTTLADGAVDDATALGPSGGAVYVGHGTLTFEDAAVSDSRATSATEDAFGGGIYVDAGTVTLRRSVVSGNTVLGADHSFGGGVYTFNGTVELADSAVEANAAPGANASSGGGLFADNGALRLLRSQVNGNTAGTDDGTACGGGISSGAPDLEITSSTVAGNSARGGFPDGACGGALFVDDGTNTVTDSTIAGNVATSPAPSSSATGGALFADVTTNHVTITGSTLSGNQAVASGDQGSASASAIFNRQGVPLDLVNTTLAGNAVAGNGGTIENLGALTLTATTMADNTGGGLLHEDGTAQIRASILAGNVGSAGPRDCDTGGPGLTVASAGGNVIGAIDDDCTFTPGPNDITGTPAAPVDARLGPLGSNGGPTATVPLLPGSPALDRTPAGTCPPPAVDQRGIPRPQGPACDAGAYELVTIQGLIDTVQRLALQHGIENSLLAKLSGAQRSLTVGKLTPTCNQLGAFLNEVSAQRGKKIDATDAQELTDEVGSVRQSLGCRAP